MKIIDRIDNLVESKKKTDSTFSASKMMKELGFSNGMYSQWKSGKKEPSKKSIEKIAEYFSTAPEYLQYGTPYPTNAVKADPAARTPVQFWGKVSAGIGAYADGVPVKAMAADDEDMQEGYEYAWLEVEGDSMYPDLQDGDYILVRVQDTAQSGDMVVALVDNGCETDGLVKRIEIEEGNHLALISTNPAYPPRVFIGDRMNDVRIFGVVVSSKRKWR